MRAQHWSDHDIERQATPEATDLVAGARAWLLYAPAPLRGLMQAREYRPAQGITDDLEAISEGQEFIQRGNSKKPKISNNT